MDEDLSSDLCTHRIWLPVCCNPIVVLGEDRRISGVPRLLVRETLSEAIKAENDWVRTRRPLLASTLVHTWVHALPVPNIHYPTERGFYIAKAKLGRGGKPPIGKKKYLRTTYMIRWWYPATVWTRGVPHRVVSWMFGLLLGCFGGEMT